MTKKIDYYQDFLKTLEIREKEIKSRKQKKLALSFIVLVFYFLALGLFFFQVNGFSFLSIFNGNQNNDLISINSKVSELENRIDSLSDSFSKSTNPSFVYLNSKIIDIESKNSYLYDTILINPDSAITPKILREEQTNLTERVQDLKSQVDKTNDLLSGIFITILLAIIGYIVKQIWGAFISKKSEAKE